MSGYASMIGGGISAAGDIQGIFGAGQAANALKDAGNQLYNNALGMYNTDQTNLNPYMQLGTQAATQLGGQLNALTAPFQPTMAQLQQSPGYQFELQQGEEAAQNGFAAQGLGVSGAAMKGAAQYAQGLAANDYTNLANIYNTNRQTSYNMLTGLTGQGMNAASTLGNLGMNDLGYQQNGLEFAANGKAQGAMAVSQGISAAGSSISGMSGAGSGSGSSILSML